MNTNVIKKLRREACKEGREWADQYSPTEAWERCHRPDWMRWALEELRLLDQNKDRLFACHCVRETPIPNGRKVWNLLTDERSMYAVEVAERYARGETTKDELKAAQTAAWEAATKVDVIDAAWIAVRIAWLEASDAADGVLFAILDAILGDKKDMRNAAMAVQADLLRQIYPNPFD